VPRSFRYSPALSDDLEISSAARVARRTLATPASCAHQFLSGPARDALSSRRVGDYEFDLDRRVARQFGDPDRGTGMAAALPEKLRQQIRGRIDHLRLLVEAGRRGETR
jgi:hypothetical protein